MNEFKDMLLSKMEVSNLIKIIEASMDDYLYIMDLQEDTYRISAKALERFSQIVQGGLQTAKAN